MSLKEKIYDHVSHPVRREIQVPEFEETVYYTPITVLEMEKILTLSGRGASTKDFHIWTLIEKAEDADGKKIFSIEDKPILEKMGWKTLIDITNKIGGTVPPGETKKNWSQTDTENSSSPSPTGNAAL